MSMGFLHHLHRDVRLYLFTSTVHSLLHARVYVHTYMSVGAFFVLGVHICLGGVHIHTMNVCGVMHLCQGVCARRVYLNACACWPVCLKVVPMGGSVTLFMHT